MVAVLEVMVLGPLMVVVGGEQVTLAPQTGMLLLVLLLAQGRPVSALRLAELLWSQDGLQRAPATLRSHVAHLRRALNRHSGGAVSGAGIHGVMTQRMGSRVGYALSLDPDRLDIVRFERLAREGRERMDAGRWGEAFTSITAALGLWRGQPFADVADRPFAAAEVTRLEALHRVVWSSRVEAEVMLGRYREVTAELEMMVARWPGDGWLRELLVASLARASRTGEAVQVCRDGIALAHSQGLDPGLMEHLHADLLTAPSARTLPRASTPLPRADVNVGSGNGRGDADALPAPDGQRTCH
jgi:DNA-binding SARP family transcriptional activator